MDRIINNSAFGPGQQEKIAGSLNNFIQALVLVAPQLAPHLLSGGVFEIKTLSGMHMKLGFGPEPGGLITPGGIRPVNGGRKT